jgi:hypothetical protein
MKHIYSITLLTILIMFSGCASTEPTPTNFNENYVIPIKKNHLKKTDSLKINIETNKNKFIQKTEDKWLGSRKPMEINEETNNIVLKNFLNQYFQEVNISDIKTDINIKSKIISLKYFNSQTGGLKKLIVELNIIVEKNGKEILNKIYKESPENVDDAIAFNFRLDMDHILELKNEDYHRGLFWIYETKFKPDLLKALEENK